MSTTNQATRHKNISSPLAVGTTISFQSEAERPGGPFISADMRNLRSKRNPVNQNKLSLRRRLFPRPSSVLSWREGTIGRNNSLPLWQTRSGPTCGRVSRHFDGRTRFRSRSTTPTVGQRGEHVATAGPALCRWLVVRLIYRRDHHRHRARWNAGPTTALDHRSSAQSESDFLAFVFLHLAFFHHSFVHQVRQDRGDDRITDARRFAYESRRFPIRIPA